MAVLVDELGPTAFYHGESAAAIVEAVNADGDR
jgi:gamma-glutamyltranspeptidase